MTRGAILRGLFASFPKANNDPYPEDTITAYNRGLARIPDDELRVAVDVAVEEAGRYVPTIGEIVRVHRRLNPRPDYVAPAWEHMGMSRAEFYNRSGTPEWLREIVMEGEI